MDRRTLLHLRGQNISMIFHNPLTSLNPLFTVEKHFLETIHFHDASMPREKALAAVGTMLETLGIEKKRLKEYPHQLSGGMRQRAMIALAITGRPRVLIADEPTTALDVTVQRSILELLGELRRSTGMSMIIVTHDLAVIEAVTDRVAIVYAGMTVESGITADVLAHPAHPYTRALLAARPSARKHNERLAAIAGFPPTPEDWPVGCRFAPRCGYVQDGCLAARPPLEIARTGQAVACLRHAEIADA